ncbi:MAG: hypothetical protein J5I91_03950 [Bacteroidetes bacterium]|nr:hypothetical protein [Bacteroidota bacterium]
MQYINLKNFIFSFFTLVLLTGCNHDPLNINTGNIEVKLKIKRFEQDFYKLKEVINSDEKFTLGLKELKDKYGSFYYDWVQAPGLMGIGDANSPETKQVLKEILASQTLEKLMKIINAHFKDFRSQERQLTNAFKHFKYYFPKEPIPDIVTFFSNFSMTLNPVGQGYVGISLDMHLGDTFYMYKSLQPPIENYFHKLFVPENIAALTMLAHGNDLFYYTNKDKSFADNMFYWGKLLYFTEAMMPYLPKHYIIGYTKEEYKFCTEEEKNIWDYIIKSDILYSSEKREYYKFFSEGPFTVAQGVPPKTPPMLGKFVGWQAVRTFMKKNPSITLSELMKMDDAETFLRKVKYKP